MTVNANCAPVRIRFNLEPLRIKNLTKNSISCDETTLRELSFSPERLAAF
jgi:hypothetical protein